MQQKSNKTLSAKGRILLYLENKGYSQYDFSKKTGLSNGFLKSGNSISSDNLKLLSNIYSDLNLIWVITGEGNMLISDKNLSINQSLSGNNNQMAGGNVNIKKNEYNLIGELKKQLDNKDNMINNLLKQQELLFNQINILTSKLTP